MTRILTLDEARAATESPAAAPTLSRQQRRALERMGKRSEASRDRMAAVADGVVERSFGQPTPGVSRGDEERSARVKDVLQLMAGALAEYDTTKSAEIMEYVEYRFSLRGRLAMSRSRWAYRAGRVVRAIATRVPRVAAWLASHRPTDPTTSERAS